MTRKKFSIIPCNGLDKALGVVAGRAAIQANSKDDDIALICPVLLNNDGRKYEDQITGSKIICVNGCMTRCATKLIEARGLTTNLQILVPEMVKKFNIKPGHKLVLDENGIKLAELIANEIITKVSKYETEAESEGETSQQIKLDEDFEYFEIRRDKFYFRVPKSRYYFNENDCWVRADESGRYAFLGISDFLQNQAGDILYVDLPEEGKEFEQFDEVGSFESVKTVLDLISPVSGKVVATNKELLNKAELLNQDPYISGWVVKVELNDFDNERELLLDGPAYFEFMKKKIEEESKKL
ncbi:MAG: glycine cleavage system protein GcvH [Promethearchaeota archaeon]